MDNENVYTRVKRVRIGFLVLFGVVVLRLWFLQILMGQTFDQRARGNRMRSIRIQAPRGVIFDRTGKILVSNQNAYSLAVVPSEIADQEQLIAVLSKLVQMKKEELEDILSEQVAHQYDPVVIKDNLDIKTLSALEEHRFFLPGVMIQRRPIRLYPHHRLGCHLLGYVGQITEEELEEHAEEGYQSGDQLGKSGIEKEYDSWLQGVDGREEVEVDAKGRLIRRLGRRDPLPGNNLILTIDLQLQQTAETSLGNKPGAVVVLDVNTGEVLAMASHPTFDPNVFSTAVSPREWKQLISNARHPLQNRAIASKYPPGSTFKLVTASAGLSLQLFTPQSSFYCSGVYKLGQNKFRCWKHVGHGTNNLIQALAKSCDVYFYSVGRALGVKRLDVFAQDYGYGRKTGIDLPTEVAGTLPSEEWKKKKLHEHWYVGDTVNMAIGQGFLQATPLQVACMTSAVANGGRWHQPHLLKNATAGKGKSQELKPVWESRILNLDPNHLAAIRAGMRASVTDRGGTAHIMQMDGLDVAGKTGSAEDIRGHLPHAWFTSFAPVSQPKMVVLSFVENGGHGGTEAAPIAREIYRQAFNLKTAGSQAEIGQTD